MKECYYNAMIRGFDNALQYDDINDIKMMIKALKNDFKNYTSMEYPEPQPSSQ